MHVRFEGFLSEVGLQRLLKEHGDEVVFTTFFGGTGYRENEDQSWYFYTDSKKVIAVHVKKAVFCLLDKHSKPATTDLPVKPLPPRPNNVVKLR